MSIENVMNRRSVRSFTEEPVSDQDLKNLLMAGMAAPSAVNRKPWEFIVLRDPDRRKALSAICQFWQPAAAAPLAIVVCGDTRGGDEYVETYYVQDCACASENILVAATGLGLGGVWLGVYGENLRMAGTASLLGIPKGVYPISILAIGHPEWTPAPHNEYNAAKVHFERF